MAAGENAARRKGYIAVALRRARPGTGSSSHTLSARTSSYNGMNLQQIIRHTRFVVVGDVATRLHMPERATLDIDLLIHAREAASEASRS